MQVRIRHVPAHCIFHPFKFRDEVIDIISSRCNPQLFPNSYITTIEGKNLVVVEVPPGSKRPYYITSRGINEGTFVRIGASSRIAGQDILKDLVLEGSNRSFDALDFIDGRGIGLSQESIGRLCNFIKIKSGIDVTSISLVNMGLLRETDEGFVPSRAFMLLTDNPYYHARIQCARFRGPGETEFIDRKEFTDSIIDQVDSAIGFVTDHLNMGARIEGLYREDIPEIPLNAIREIITNAVLHRSYSHEGSPIFVAVYDDRVEVTSPGMLPQGMTVEGMLSEHSNPRNVVLSRFFRDTHLSEGWRKGVKRAMDSCVAYGLRRPDILEIDDMIKVVIYRAGSEYVPNVKASDFPLNDLEELVLDYLEANPQDTVDDVAKHLGRPYSTVRKSVSKLKAKGILSRTGSKSKGVWEVTHKSR